ncbi:hypothetical protein D3C78_1510340 [compost metagenome]
MLCLNVPSLRLISRVSLISPVRMTASNPSSMTSTRRSVKSRSRLISGYASMKADIVGISNMPASGRLTRSCPRGTACDLDNCACTVSYSDWMRRQVSRKKLPSSVSAMLRVERLNSLTPSSSSRRAMAFPTADPEMPRRCPAATKLPASAT